MLENSTNEIQTEQDLCIHYKIMGNEGRMCHYWDNSDNIGPGLPIGLFLERILMLNTEIIGKDILENLELIQE